MFTKSNFLRSMFKVSQSSQTSNGLRRPKGPENQSNLDATGVCNKIITGPFCFKETDGSSLTIKSEQYIMVVIADTKGACLGSQGMEPCVFVTSAPASMRARLPAFELLQCDSSHFVAFKPLFVHIGVLLYLLSF